MIIPKNILIVRTDRIGDVVLSLPLAGIIKKYYPACKVTFLIRSYTKALVEDNPFVDDILILHERNNKLPIKKNIKEISGRSYDSAIVVNATFLTAFIIFLSRIKVRIGTGYRWYSFLFNRRIYIHRKYAQKHELEFNVELLKEFGINETVTTGNVKFNLFSSPESKKRIENEFNLNNIKKDKPVFIVHPGSGGSSIDLPISKFRNLVGLMDSKLDINLIVTGSEQEKGICKELISGTGAKNFAGTLNLSDLIALIEKADLFISNSTGPIHIAAALNKNVIGFYPKILSCSPQRWGPFTNKKFIFMPEINCYNCNRKQCEGLDCMNSIDIDRVFGKIEDLYNSILKEGEFNA